MTSAFNDYFRSLVEDDLESFVSAKQTQFMQMLERFKPHIDELTHRRLCAEVFEGSTFCEAIDYFTQIGDTLCMAVLENKRLKILQRMANGAEMIENEPDPIRQLKFKAIYTALERELEKL